MFMCGILKLVSQDLTNRCANIIYALLITTYMTAVLQPSTIHYYICNFNYFNVLTVCV